MTMDLRRSTHPDLLDELDQVQPPQSSESQPTNGSVRARRRRNGSTAQPEPSPPGDSAAPVAEEGHGSEEEVSPSSEPAAPEAPEVPEWLTSARAAEDPLESLRLLIKNVPRDRMEQDDTLRGWLGDYANQRARRMLEEQDRQRAERARSEAYDKGDLYTLGQLTAADLQQQR